MRMYIKGVFRAPLEELQEKHGVGLQLHIFFGVGVFGAGRVWHQKLMELLEFLEFPDCTSSILSTDCTVEFYVMKRTKLDLIYIYFEDIWH